MRLVAYLYVAHVTRLVTYFYVGNVTRLVAYLYVGNVTRLVAYLYVGNVTRLVMSIYVGNVTRFVAYLYVGNVTLLVAYLYVGNVTRLVAYFVCTVAIVHSANAMCSFVYAFKRFAVRMCIWTDCRMNQKSHNLYITKLFQPVFSQRQHKQRIFGVFVLKCRVRCVFYSIMGLDAGVTMPCFTH